MFRGVVSGERLPIYFGPCASDEYLPQPHDAFVAEMIRRATEACDQNARRLGLDRRAFLRSLCASATVLLALDACTREAGKPGTAPGGRYPLPSESELDPSPAATALDGDEFIFDVQGHLLDRTLDPLAVSEIDSFTASFPQRRCGEHDPRDCFSIEHFLDDMFVRSDTDMLVLSALPLPDVHDPLSPRVMRLTKRISGVLCHDDRVLLHGKVAPTTRPLPEVLSGMEQLAAAQPIVGWKTYTHLLGPGWFLDDHDRSAPQVGDAILRKIVELGQPRIAVHKGLTGGAYNTPVDVGPAARRHRDIFFLIYHSGYQIGIPEGPYTPSSADVGSNRLIRSLEQAGIGPNENVYAELGTTWWQVMRYPTQAAHLLGKLLRHVGTDNVIWGTDSIWYGPPQGQIEAFRAFEISTEFQERYGYPALTKDLKAKVLGLNGARVYGVETPTATRCRRFTRRELAQVRRSLSTH